MTPVGRSEGLGDFVKGEEAYRLYLSGKPFMERLIFGNVTYSRRVGEDVWKKGEDATTPEQRRSYPYEIPCWIRSNPSGTSGQ